MIVEFWDKEEGGMLSHSPLLREACIAGIVGKRTIYAKGSIEDALFTFVTGEPDEAFFRENPELFYGKYLVPMSREWEDFLKTAPGLDTVMKRHMMKPRFGVSEKTLTPLPAGYRLASFDEEAFSRHPFDHGTRYRDYEAFAESGAGAVVWYGGEIVASASSFLTYENHVELDVSTAPDHRRKGLADHCVFQMLAECAEKGLTVHWDAQNQPSYRMALSHGFAFEEDYAVYVLNKAL